MKNNIWIILLLLLIFVSGCVAYRSIIGSQSQNELYNIKENESISDLDFKASSKFQAEIHEHLQFPILKLGNNEESAYPCKLTWIKSGNENWKIAKINGMKNHEK